MFINVSNQTSSRHDFEYPRYNRFTGKKHLPLCFSSFEILKENHEVTKEAGKSDCNNTALHKKMVLDEEYPRPSRVLNDHVANYTRGHFSLELQHMLYYQPEKEDEADQEIVVKGYFPPRETNIDMKQDF